VSDHIKALEAELNCAFDRLPRKIIPTREAAVLIVRAQEIIERVEGFKDVLAEFRKDLSGHLVIGASTIPGTYILPGLTALFRQKNQSVLFEIVVSDSRAIIDKVAGNELLIGIVGAKLESRQVDYEPFLEDELIAVASPEVFKAKKGMGIREIAKSPIVMREQGPDRRSLKSRGSIFSTRYCRIRLTDAIKQAVKGDGNLDNFPQVREG
jgi:DNA-binding transcriptional LysR family regulator